MYKVDIHTLRSNAIYFIENTSEARSEGRYDGVMQSMVHVSFFLNTSASWVGTDGIPFFSN